MFDITFIAVVILIFASINFFDFIFKSCMLFPYIRFLQETGIMIKPFGIVWETKRFNRKFRQLSHFKPVFLRAWFQVGAYVTMICMMPAFCLVSYSFWQSLDVTLKPLQTDDSQVVRSNNINISSINTPILMPIIPGFTLPLSQMYFYIGTLFLCIVIHEMGHAIAACRENITIEGCGIALYGIFPLAYIRLPGEQLKNLLPWQQLRVYSAGVWHNIVLSGFALLLMWTNPIILSPAFQLGKGVTIVSVETDSGIGQPGGLVANDEIFSINGCEVRNIDSWAECLEKFHAQNNQGFCASSNFIKLKDIAFENKSVNACCPDSNEHLCFQDMDIKTHFCLPGRKLAEKAKVCYNKEDCGDELCLIPIFPSTTSRLLKIERYLKSPVMYVGSIPDLKRSVTVNGWTAKFRALSVGYVDIYETILVYIVTFSCGLAIMNLIPCHGFDGAHLTELIVHFFMSNVIRQYEHRIFFINSLNFLGLFISLGAIIYGLMKFV